MSIQSARTGGVQRHAQASRVTRIARALRFTAQGGLLASFLALGSAAQAGITFQFDYGANNGTGFWDSVLGAERQQALTTAASSFSSMFGSYFSNSATIVIQAQASDDPLSNNLASAGTYLTVSGTPGFTLGEVVKSKLQNGVDLNGAAADAVVNVNFGQPWQLNANTPPSAGQYDLYSTLYHEFTHTIGFASTIGRTGNDLLGATGPGQWVAFDKFIVDANGNSVFNADHSINHAVWDTASVGGTGAGQGLFFNGTFAKLANGGDAVSLYSPTTWLQGSSGSHLNTDNPAYLDMLMLHATDTGPGARNYSAIEVAMLRDLGYTVTAVPEPETYALMVAGLFMVGWRARGQKRA